MGREWRTLSARVGEMVVLWRVRSEGVEGVEGEGSGRRVCRAKAVTRADVG